MALCNLRFNSDILGTGVGMNVIIPEKHSGELATFYLLHGLTDDYTGWLRRTRIDSYVTGLPMVVVMPDGGRGFYTNHDHGPAWARFFAEELVSFVERTFPVKRTRTARCIGGLSMGGYGALRLALGYPDVYASATSHSGAVLSWSRKNNVLSADERWIMFGDQKKGSKHDLLRLARDAKKAGRIPKLRIDCGTEDHLIDDNRSLHRNLERLGIPHEYEEFPGGHEWEYWDLHVRDAIAFHRRALKI